MRRRASILATVAVLTTVPMSAQTGQLPSLASQARQSLASAGQTKQPLSLRDAEARELQNHPQVIAGQLIAQAGSEPSAR